MTKKSRSTHVSVLEAAHRVPDPAVENVPEVLSAARARTEAEQRYQEALVPYLAELRRMERLKAEMEAAKARMAAANEDRYRNAVAIVDGEIDEAADDRLVAEIERLGRAMERAAWALPALEQRVEELQAPVRRSADHTSDCDRALADARLDAKIDFVTRG